MYLCGRSLRQGEPRRKIYLWFGIFGFLGAAILSGMAEAFSFYDSYELYSSFGYGVAVGSAIIDVTLMGLLLASPYLNVLFLLLVLLMAARSKSKHSRSNRSLWVTCAVVYCIAHIPPTFLSYHFIRSAFEGGGLFGAPAVPRFVSAIGYALLLLGLVMLLYRKRSSASCLAWVVVAIQCSALWFNWYSMWSLVQSSIVMLEHSVPLTTQVNMPFFITKHDFYWLGVASVRFVLPWLLIAWYSRRVPMLRPSEDDVPFPQQFCGVCHYNLHGIKKDRCPECGSDLDMQSQAESTG